MQAINPQQLIADSQRLFLQGRLADAEILLRQLLAETPDNHQLLHHVGLLCHRQRKFLEAAQLVRQAIALDPASAPYHVTLGESLREQGRFEEAVESYRRAIGLQPDLASAHYNMGVALRQMNRLDDSIDSYRQAVRFDPNHARALNNLGTALRAQGRVGEALPALRRAIEISPTPAGHSNLLYAMWFDPESLPAAILAEHARFARQWCDPLTREIQPFTNDRDPNRRLRIGYVSPDLRRHVIGLFMRPILHHRDRKAVETFCYADVPDPDFMSDRLRADADVWVSTTGLSDAQIAERVRQDGIDILVDLTAHMARNRMLVFARKPAPVQVSHLAYAGTTGLPTIDYRLSDVNLDPGDSAFGVEKVLPLPETYWCYEPAIELPEIAPIPRAANHLAQTTFACFNSSAKIHSGVIELWSSILKQLPGSRIRLIADGGETANKHFGLQFAQHGVDPNRVEIFDTMPYEKYFGLYADVDVALDPFPYNGGTTTLDALYMGVPVVSLAGGSGMSRAGVSILTNSGLSELIARTQEEYVQIATELARDVPRLVNLRKQLRERVARSALMDAPRFVRCLEAAYRVMWRQYCE